MGPRSWNFLKFSTRNRILNATLTVYCTEPRVAQSWQWYPPELGFEGPTEQSVWRTRRRPCHGVLGGAVECLWRPTTAKLPVQTVAV